MIFFTDQRINHKDFGSCSLSRVFLQDNSRDQREKLKREGAALNLPLCSYN